MLVGRKLEIFSQRKENNCRNSHGVNGILKQKHGALFQWTGRFILPKIPIVK